MDLSCDTYIVFTSLPDALHMRLSYDHDPRPVLAVQLDLHCKATAPGFESGSECIPTVAQEVSRAPAQLTVTQEQLTSASDSASDLAL